MNSTIIALDVINTTNVTDAEPERQVLKGFIRTLMPLIVVCGILGNMMSTWVLHAQLVQKSSFTLYLLARSLTDTGFLVPLFIIWLDTVDVRWFHVEGICQITVFLSYVCSFLSAWFVTYAALENYIRMCRPDMMNLYCNANKARRIIMMTVSGSIVAYTFPLWTANVETIDGAQYCQPNPRFHQFLLVVVNIDTLCSFVVPLVVVLMSMCGVAFSSYMTYKRRLRMGHNLNGGDNQTNHHTKATLFLMGISLSFLILHTPIHVFRLRIMILSIVRGSLESARFEQIDRDLKKYFEMMYYFNFSINFLIYFVCGKTFRDVLQSKLCNTVRNSNVRKEYEDFDEIHSDIELAPLKNNNIINQPGA